MNAEPVSKNTIHQIATSTDTQVSIQRYRDGFYYFIGDEPTEFDEASWFELDSDDVITIAEAEKDIFVYSKKDISFRLFVK